MSNNSDYKDYLDEIEDVIEYQNNTKVAESRKFKLANKEVGLNQNKKKYTLNDVVASARKANTELNETIDTNFIAVPGDEIDDIYNNIDELSVSDFAATENVSESGIDEYNNKTEDDIKYDNNYNDEDQDLLARSSTEQHDNNHKKSNNNFGLTVKMILNDYIIEKYTETKNAVADKKNFYTTIINLLVEESSMILAKTLIDYLGEENIELIQLIIKNKLLVYFVLSFKLTDDNEAFNYLESKLKESELRENADEIIDIIIEYKNNQIDDDDLDVEFDTITNSLFKYAQPKSNLNFDEFELTEGSIKETTKDYDIINIPEQKISMPMNINCINIKTSLPKWVWPFFLNFNIQTLNHIQSIVFNDTFYTDQNILICAPTGSGKTNIAFIAILRLLNKYIDEKNLCITDNNFKVIYVSPMKALVAEQVESFQSKFNLIKHTTNNKININVCEMTGDNSIAEAGLSNYQILVCTPEKFDVMMRKTGERVSTTIVKLIIFDEIHLLHNTRGPVIESLITRIIVRKLNIRLIGLSATLPNADDVANFFHLEKLNTSTIYSTHKGLYVFNQAFRPIPLKYKFFGIKGIKNQKNSNLYNTIAYNCSIEFVRKQKQIIIFTHSRQDTYLTARYICTKLFDTNEINYLFDGDIANNASIEILQEEANKLQNKQLKQLFEFGIAFHNAGLNRNDRSIVEKFFLSGYIKIIVSTSTLAWGVNLPAHAVLIKGTLMYSSELSRYIQISDLDLVQMLGRAGRPQFDTIGNCIVITSHDQLFNVIAKSLRNVPVESQLLTRILEIINAEIFLGTINSYDELVQYLKKSYYYIRLLKSPVTYRLFDTNVNINDELLQKTAHDWIKDLANKICMYLHDNKFIILNDKNGICQSTTLGRIAAVYYIKLETIVHINNNLQSNLTLTSMFNLISTCPEFDNISVRATEYDILKDLAMHSPIPILGTSKQRSFKVNILLQCYISNVDLSASNLIGDIDTVRLNATRICGAIEELSYKKKLVKPIELAIYLQLAIKNKLWLSNSVLRQFEGIDENIINICESMRLDYISIRNFNEKDTHELGQSSNVISDAKLASMQIPVYSCFVKVLPKSHDQLTILVNIIGDVTHEARINNSNSICILLTSTSNEKLYYYNKKSLSIRKILDGFNFTILVDNFDYTIPYFYLYILSQNWLINKTVFAIPVNFTVKPSKTYLKSSITYKKPLKLIDLNFGEFQEYLKKCFENYDTIKLTQHLLQSIPVIIEYYSNFLVNLPFAENRINLAHFSICKTLSMTKTPLIFLLFPTKVLADYYYIYIKNIYEKNFNLKVNKLNENLLINLLLVKFSHLLICTFSEFEVLSKQKYNYDIFSSTSLVLCWYGEYMYKDSLLEVIFTRIRIHQETKNDYSLRIGFIGFPTISINDISEWLGTNNNTTKNYPVSSRRGKLEIVLSKSNIINTKNKVISRVSTVFPYIERALKANTKIAIINIDYGYNNYIYNEILNYININHVELIVDSNLLNILSDHDIYHSINEQCSLKNFNPQIGIINLFALEFVTNQFDVVILLDNEKYDYINDIYESISIHDIKNIISACLPNSKLIIYTNSSDELIIKDYLFNETCLESNLVHSLSEIIISEIASERIKNIQNVLDWITWSFFQFRLAQNPNFYGLSEYNEEMVSELVSGLAEKALFDLQNSDLIKIESDEETITPDETAKILLNYSVSYNTLVQVIKSNIKSIYLDNILVLCSEIYEMNNIYKQYCSLDINQTILQKLINELNNNIMIDHHITSSIELNIDLPSKQLLLLLYAHFYNSQILYKELINFKHVLSMLESILSLIIDILTIQGFKAESIAVMELTQLLVHRLVPNNSKKMNQYLQLPHITSAQQCNIIYKYGLNTPIEIANSTDKIRLELFEELELSGENVEDIAVFINNMPVVDIIIEESEKEALNSQMTTMLNVKILCDSDDNYAAQIHDYLDTRYNIWWLLLTNENKTIHMRKIIINSGEEIYKFDLDKDILEQSDYFEIYMISSNYIGLDKKLIINYKTAT